MKLEERLYFLNSCYMKKKTLTALYTLSMLRMWYLLRKYPILNLHGIDFLKLRLKYLILAVIFPRSKSKKSEVEVISSEGRVWFNFNLWLNFQTKYVDSKWWAVSPIIRRVTLVNLEEIKSEQVELISTESKQLISLAASRYANTFRGISSPSYVNWITRNFLLVNAFKDHGVVPFFDERGLVEIGPGLGPVLTMACLSKPVSVYSFDTFQMQEIFSAVQDNFRDDFKKLRKIAINTEENTGTFSSRKKSTTLIAFWSFTELTLSERKRYFEVFGESSNALIATNEYFEGINNFEYLEQLALLFDKKISFKKLTEVLGMNIPRYQHNHRIYLLESK
jgi:hypothetical protein